MRAASMQVAVGDEAAADGFHDVERGDVAGQGQLVGVVEEGIDHGLALDRGAARAEGYGLGGVEVGVAGRRVGGVVGDGGGGPAVRGAGFGAEVGEGGGGGEVFGVLGAGQGVRGDVGGEDGDDVVVVAVHEVLHGVEVGRARAERRGDVGVGEEPVAEAGAADVEAVDLAERAGAGGAAEPVDGGGVILVPDAREHGGLPFGGARG